MRALFRDGVSWAVREAAAARTPGARGARCLIFDSDAVVRRIWDFPEHWMELDDDALWALTCNAALPAPIAESTAGEPALPSAPFSTHTLASETTAIARSLIDHITSLRSATRSRSAGNALLLLDCQNGRCAMRSTVQAFAAAMRSEGLAPEAAIVLIKGAVIEGVGLIQASEDPDAEMVIRDAVSWGIAAYFAA